jgi:hypothetical protein
MLESGAILRTQSSDRFLPREHWYLRINPNETPGIDRTLMSRVPATTLTNWAKPSSPIKYFSWREIIMRK